MSHPTFAIVVTFQIKPDCIAKFLPRVQQQASDSVHLEEGCIQFDVLVDEKDPTIVVLYETYVDAPAFDIHRETTHFAQFNETVTPWVQSKEVRRLTLLEGV
jgi:(4S)-4-hydroxy-5-phosphonooxypentane-2,3-dione isomerase